MTIKLALHFHNKITSTCKSITNRNIIISSNAPNTLISVYSGKSFFPLVIHASMIGFKTGSFIATKKHCIFKKEKQKKKFSK